MLSCQVRLHYSNFLLSLAGVNSHCLLISSQTHNLRLTYPVILGISEKLFGKFLQAFSLVCLNTFQILTFR